MTSGPTLLAHVTVSVIDSAPKVAVSQGLTISLLTEKTFVDPAREAVMVIVKVFPI